MVGHQKKTKPTVIQELKRSRRWSLLPAFTIEGYIVYKIHHGSITSEILNQFVRQKYCPFVLVEMDLDQP